MEVKTLVQSENIVAVAFQIYTNTIVFKFEYASRLRDAGTDTDFTFSVGGAVLNGIADQVSEYAGNIRFDRLNAGHLEIDG